MPNMEHILKKFYKVSFYGVENEVVTPKQTNHCIRYAFNQENVGCGKENNN